jgi:hypothetical protein
MRLKMTGPIANRAQRAPTGNEFNKFIEAVDATKLAERYAQGHGPKPRPSGLFQTARDGNTVQWVDTHPGLLCREGWRYGGSPLSSPKEEAWMNFSTQQHKHYGGIDLHAKAMDVCVLDQHGTKLVHKNLSTTPEAVLRAFAPYREDLVVGGGSASSPGIGSPTSVSKKGLPLS